MKSFRIFGIALLAVFAGSAAVSAHAMASAQFNLLSPETFPVAFTAKSGSGVLETVGGLSIKCTADTKKGEIRNPTEGVVTVTFTGCKEGTLACRSIVGTVKDPIETVLVENQLFYPVEISKGTKGGIAFKLASPVVILCGTAKDEVKGSVIGEFSPVNSEVTTATVTLSQAKGGQKVVALNECVETGLPKPSCAELKADPLLGKLGTSFESAGLETKEDLTFSKMIELHIV